MADASRFPRPPAWIVAAVVLVVSILGLYLLIGRAGGPFPVLGDYDPAALEASVDEALDPVAARTYRTLRVTGRTIRWQDGAGRPFLESPRITASVSVSVGDGVLISDGVIDRPRLRLVQTGEERWNYDRPLAPLLSDDPGEGEGDGETPVRMRNVVLDQGYVLLELLDATYEARSLDVRLASAQLAGPGLDAPVFRIERAETELVLPDSGQGEVVRSVTVSDARLRVLDGAVAFEVARGTFGESRLTRAEGVWDPARGGLGLDLRMTGEEVRVADLPWLPGAVPEGASGRFELRVEPRPGGRSAVSLTDLDLRAPGSSATGSLQAVIGGASPVLESIDVRVDPLSLDLVEAFTGPLPYSGTVTGTIRGSGGDVRFDLAGQLTTPTISEPFHADLAGRAGLTEDGFTLRDATVSLDRVPLAALNEIAPGLPFRGPVTGTVELRGPPGSGPLDLDLRLEAGGGIITVEGTADLGGAVPAYDLSGRIAGVELRSVMRPAAPPVEVHAEFSLEGRGTAPETADATLVANGTFTGWQTGPQDTLAVQARVAEGVVEVDRLALEAGPVALSGQGRWDFVDGGGRLEYDLAVSDLEPLAPYLPADAEGRRRFARGRLELTGTASGTLEAPRLAGEVAADDFRWGEWATESLDGEYALALVDEIPRVDTRFSADELRTPVGDFEAVSVLVNLGRPDFELAVEADQPGGRGILSITADGRIDAEGRRDVFVRSLEVDLQEQRWRLPSPARVAWTAGDAVRIEGFRLLQADGDGRIQLDGIAAPVDDLDLTLEVVGLPVGEVIRLVGADLALSGELAVDGRLSGPAGSPGMDLQISLADGEFRGVTVREVQASMRYEGTGLAVDGRGLIGDSARLSIEGHVPARILLADGPLFALVDDGPIDLRIITQTFPLSTLDPGLASAEDLEGRLQADLRVAGTPAEPRLSGSARLDRGAVTIPLLDRRFQGIRGSVVLDGREARLRDVVVESDGTATITGTLSFQELTNPVLNLAAELNRFRVQGVEDETGAGVWGQLELGGTLDEPVLGGSVRVNDGAVSLAPLQQPELSDRLGDVGQVDLLDPGADFGLGAADEAGLSIRDLRVEAGNELWFVTEEARVRLGGNLTVNQTGDAVAIQGTLQGEGGTFELSAGVINRQFRIVSAEIRFFGSPEPNPRLDIVASRLVRVPEGGEVDIRVHVGGTLQSPSLSLATAAGSDVPESELLSFLMFGRQSAELGDVALGGGGVGGALGQGLAYTGLTEMLSSALAEQVGVDYFRVDWLPSGALYATAGVEVTDNLFFDVDVPLGSLNEQYAFGLEYRWEGVGTLRGAYEPVNSLDQLVGIRARTFIETEVSRQWLLAWRRRWTY